VLDAKEERLADFGQRDLRFDACDLDGDQRLVNSSDDREWLEGDRATMTRLRCGAPDSENDASAHRKPLKAFHVASASYRDMAPPGPPAALRFVRGVCGCVSDRGKRCDGTLGPTWGATSGVDWIAGRRCGGPAAATGDSLVASLAAHSPITDTPMLPALLGAVSYAMTWKGQHPGEQIAVVLVTDGQPKACGANTMSEIVTVAKQGYVGGVRTYVVGVVTPGSTCALDPNQPSPSDLDPIAASGGTNKAFIAEPSNTQTSAAVQVANALASAATSLRSSCGCDSLGVGTCQ
jgi:hypothetical protein